MSGQQEHIIGAVERHNKTVAAKKHVLLVSLRKLNHNDKSGCDVEYDHIEADKLLLQFIGDDEVTRAFDEIEKWY